MPSVPGPPPGRSRWVSVDCSSALPTPVSDGGPDPAPWRLPNRFGRIVAPVTTAVKRTARGAGGPVSGDLPCPPPSSPVRTGPGEENRGGHRRHPVESHRPTPIQCREVERGAREVGHLHGPFTSSHPSLTSAAYAGLSGPRGSDVGDEVGMSAVLQVNGGTPLKGEISVRGAKNFVSKAMVAALLGEDPSELRNVPQIKDVEVVSGLLRLHGVTVDYDVEAGVIRLDSSDVEPAHVADIDAHAGSSRIPILFCGPLLHRLGEAFIPDLGGCRIGDRPIDYHLSILREFGAIVDKR